MWEVACCMLFIMIFIFLITYFVFRNANKTKKSPKCPECGGPISTWNMECQWCGKNLVDPDERSYQYGTNDDIGGRPSPINSYKEYIKNNVQKNPLLSLFKKKNVCPDCGTELIYRKEYLSWYCTECHSYQ